MLSETRKQYYQKNKKRILEGQRRLYRENIKERSEQSKVYRENNKEKIAERNKKYRKNNKEKVIKYQKEWKDKNKEKMRKYHKQYGREHRDVKLFYCIKSRAKRKGIKMMSKKDFVDWYNSQTHKCHYCDITKDKLMLNAFSDNFERCSLGLSVDRVDNDEGYIIGNVVLCCYLCNTMKRNIFTEQEMLRIGKIIKTKWKKRLKELK